MTQVMACRLLRPLKPLLLFLLSLFFPLLLFFSRLLSHPSVSAILSLSWFILILLRLAQLLVLRILLPCSVLRFLLFFSLSLFLSFLVFTVFPELLLHPLLM